MSKSRRSQTVLARNTAFFLARKHTQLSLAAIGDRLGRKHSTVLKGIINVERELSHQTPLGRQIASTRATGQPTTTHTPNRNRKPRDADLLTGKPQKQKALGNQGLFALKQWRKGRDSNPRYG